MAKRGHEFTPAEIDRALTALALSGGNAPRALEQLKQDETLTRTPSDDSLYVWRDKYADRYAEIREQRAPEIERAAINDYRAMVAQAAQTSLKAVEKTNAVLDSNTDVSATELSTVARNLALAGGIAADKLLVFTDRPNVITERRDPTELLRAIDAITGHAEELKDLPLIGESRGSNARELAAGDDVVPVTGVRPVD